jgi:hypothetical protein
MKNEKIEKNIKLNNINIKDKMSVQSKNTKESFKETHKEPVTCGICYNDLNTENCVVTICKHKFCNTCFFKWLDKKETCALCRATLLNDDVVKERAENLQVIQEDLVINYQYLKRIRKEVQKKEEEVKLHDAKAVSLQGRQIRLRMMLEQLRQECEDVFPENLKRAKKTLKTLNKSFKLLNKYNKRCDEIWENQIDPQPTETKVDFQQKEEESPDNFPDVLNMMDDLDEMIEADRIIYHAQRRVYRQRHIEMAAREIIFEEEAAEEAAEEERVAMEFPEETTEELSLENSPSRNRSQSPFVFDINAPVTFNFGNTSLHNIQ